MNEKIRNDVLAIVQSAVDILKEKDVRRLQDLSNRTVHNSSIFQDKDSIQMAVLVYALSKIIYRGKERIPEGIIEKLERAGLCLINGDFKQYRKTIKDLFAEISRIDKKLKLYVEEVIEQGKIKKGSKIYEHGISMAQAAEILGVSQWELMKYVGQTKIADVSYGKTDVRRRLEFARNLFK